MGGNGWVRVCKEEEDSVQSPSSLPPPQSQGAGRVARAASAAVCRCVDFCFVLLLSNVVFKHVSLSSKRSNVVSR